MTVAIITFLVSVPTFAVGALRRVERRSNIHHTYWQDRLPVWIKEDNR